MSTIEPSNNEEARDVFTAHVTWLREHRDVLQDDFYARMFERYPEIKACFGSYTQPQQRLMLNQILSSAVDSFAAEPWLTDHLSSLGCKHADWEVTPEMYGQLAECLLESLEQVSGTQWTEQLSTTWLERLDWIAVSMQEDTDEPTVGVSASAGGCPHHAAKTGSAYSEYDLLSMELHTSDPWDFYTWLRDEEPLFWDAVNEIWAVSRFDDVVFVSTRTDLFCSGEGVIPGLGLDIWPDEAMINLDGKAHTKQRGLVARGFSPRRIEAMEDRIRQIANDLIDAMLAEDEVDLVHALARPLPFRAIAHMLGYPAGKEEDVLEWTDEYSKGGNGIQGVTEEVVEAFENFVDFHEELLADKKENPGEDLLSLWLAAELNGEKLSEDKLMYEHNLLLVGGSETTRTAISMGVAALLEHPEQMAYLVENIDDLQVVGRAVEEMIRWSCPFVRMARTATCDVEMHGKVIKAGQQVIMLYPAANRDPRAFEHADQFDVRRNPKRGHLSFGIGKHFCLGSALARLETRVTLEVLIRRVPDLRLHPERARERVESCFVRSLATCPVKVHSPN